MTFCCVATLAAVTTVATPAAEAEQRIATVNVAKILNDSAEAQAKKKELDTLTEETKKKLDSKGKELQALKTKLEESKVAPDSKEAEKFRVQARDFERLRSDAKADLERSYMKANKDLTDKVLGKIEKYAKANNIDMVLDKSDKYRGPLLFGADTVDITEKILDE
jgi:Skp family chaperone for outer membrane proteins